MVSDEDVSVAQLAGVVSKDQVLASRLLGLANSAYFASMTEISTVQEAIVRMGTAAVRNLVVTVCYYSRMQDRNVYGDRGKPLLEHGIGTAYMARLVAEWTGLDEEEAFMYGLLHDIGKLVILKAAHDVRRQTGQPIPEAVIDQVMAETARHNRRARAAPLAPPEHARRADHLPSRLDEGDPRPEESRGDVPGESSRAIATDLGPRSTRPICWRIPCARNWGSTARGSSRPIGMRLVWWK